MKVAEKRYLWLQGKPAHLTLIEWAEELLEYVSRDELAALLVRRDRAQQPVPPELPPECQPHCICPDCKHPCSACEDSELWK